MPCRQVLVLAFDDVQILDVTGPMEVFAEAGYFAPPPAPYAVRCLGIGSGLVRASNGLVLAVESCFGYRGPVDTLVVPGGSRAAVTALSRDPAFLAWLAAMAGRARRVASVCTGAMVLAAAGLLDGRRATTHWGSTDALRAAAPLATVEPDALFTRDGPVYTSAGVSAGIDLALALVEEDVGRQVAAAVARHLVLYLRRAGGQSQFSAPLQAQSRGNGRLGSVIDFVLSAPRADLSVAALAARAAMSPRHFARAFKAETGESPARFVAASRLEAARLLLTDSVLPLKSVADLCGFASADVLGRRFRDRYRVTPAIYRERFGA